MAKLTFTGRSKDGKRLLLVDESGQEHTLAIDPRLRRAVSGAPDSTGPDTSGQLEIPMESTLRPRDIQMRIRAGESPEAVAHAAGTSVEKIMPFAAPVMAERAHVAERAQLASVRRRASESGARTLGEAVSAHLRAHDVDPASVEWDAWRREDGRWTLTALYDIAGRIGTATFSHDPRGSFVTLDDDDAHWLVGDTAPEAATATPTSDDLAAARQRRLSAVGDELPLGDDAIEMVTGEESSATPEETTMELSETGLGAEQPMEAYLDEQRDEQRDGEAPSEPVEPRRDPAAEAPAEPKPKPAKKRGRASVPSWDEIMFGGGKGD
ncbi:septation protein SepH [Nocardioides pinisoli]|uniref:Septation protein SepH n=1 Tax=Nocardioides pinisoli TaxID=2950279 RepID=A0ABT1L1Z3_9ACTN|nr:septation protein SepH [Nocardioides pinisoli]MCP3423614.1 septation protein SepH [Nocardioides pinisoli]